MDPKHFHTTLDQRKTDAAKVAQDKLVQEANAKNFQAVIDTIGTATKALIAFQKNHKTDVNVQAQLDDSKIVAAVSKLEKILANQKFPDIPKPATAVTVKNQPDYSKQFDQLSQDIKSIDVKPVVNIDVPAEQPDDYTPVLEALKEVKDAVKAIHIPDFPAIPGVDLTEVVSATEAVQRTIENLKFPIPNYILPFKNADGEATQVQLQSDGSLPITASISTGGLATSANQTNNTQTTQIVDSSGNAVTVTGNKLDVNATASLAGSSIPIASATTGVGVAILDSSGNQISSFGGGTQYTDGGTPPTHPVGTVPVYDSGGTWKSVSSTNKLPVNTGLTQPTTPSDTQPVSAASLPLPTLAATSTKQSDGSQKSQIVDGSGNVIGATSNALDVNIKSGTEAAVSTSGNITGTTSVTLTLSNSATVAVQITGTFAATMVAERSVDGTNFDAAYGYQNANSSTYQKNSFSASDVNEIWTFDVAGCAKFRIRCTAYTSGTATVNLIGVTSPNQIVESFAYIVGSSANLGVNANQAGYWTMRTADGVGNSITSTSNALDINIKSGNPTSITANAGTNLNTSALALETGGNLATTATNTGTIAGAVSSSKMATKSADGDFVTLGAKADAKSTATDTTAVSAMSVLKEISYMEQNPASRAVTNAGTFAIQNTTTTTTSTQTSVANSVTSVTLLSSNTSRKSATIYNDDTAASLYVKFGTTASTTSYKIKIAAGGYYEFPYPIYTGRVDGIASAATGSARICEET